MIQNNSYGTGQYRYDPNLEYISFLGSTNAENNPLNKNYIDYQPNTDTLYKDIIIDLPYDSINNTGIITTDETYYMEITVPRDEWYEIKLNLKLCPENIIDNLNGIDFNNFQQINSLTIPSIPIKRSIYSDVVLFEYTDNNNTSIISADIPKNFSASTSSNTNQLYKNGSEYKYYIGTNNSIISWNNTSLKSVTKYSTYNLLQGWQLKNSLSSSDLITFSIIFSPKYKFINPYKYLWLEIIHDDNYVQYSGNNGKTYTGKYLNKDYIQVSFYKINNLLPITNFGIAPIKSGINSLNQISVVAPENWMFTINGEEIKLGKSGQYELKDYNITSLGLIVVHGDEENSEFDTRNFLIDYTYKIEN